MYQLLVGTYEKNKGFHQIILDDFLNVIADYSCDTINNCSFGVEKENIFYFISEIQRTRFEKGGRLVVAKKVGNRYHLISNINSCGSNPCHIYINDQKAFISNYSTGTLAIFDISNPNVPFLINQIIYKPSSLIHSSIFINKILHVVDKGESKIYTYRNLSDLDDFTSINLPNNTAPRHIIYGKDNWFYVITENNSKLMTFTYNNLLELSLVDVKNLDKYETLTCGCAIKYYNDKLYITLRKLNQIKVFDVKNNIPTLIQTISSFGENPRDIDINKTDAFVANQDSNYLQHFYVSDDGTLIPSSKSLQISSPAFVKIKKC